MFNKCWSAWEQTHGVVPKEAQYFQLVHLPIKRKNDQHVVLKCGPAFFPNCPAEDQWEHTDFSIDIIRFLDDTYDQCKGFIALTDTDRETTLAMYCIR
jgi:hypothetical protein